ncbi:hypothetical protein O5D80_008638 [Batrachochytrium dendrobatidis]|nr:hypothetical protein O5D80_008638 [Batrachochytrium dendrobatidis]
MKYEELHPSRNGSCVYTRPKLLNYLLQMSEKNILASLGVPDSVMCPPKPLGEGDVVRQPVADRG